MSLICRDHIKEQSSIGDERDYDTLAGCVQLYLQHQVNIKRITTLVKV
jgi:hypothetical protein